MGVGSQPASLLLAAACADQGTPGSQQPIGCSRWQRLAPCCLIAMSSSSSALGPVGHEGHATDAAGCAPAMAFGHCRRLATNCVPEKNKTPKAFHRAIRAGCILPCRVVLARHGVIAAARQD
ncbi:hypothetical protein COCMIDRAFT_38177 [Bipolaris oryzae ATCC 44560]|uniref:Uncharacterized protein n=1 Tax=Bipolaris oryzae ATCC 44560 TaxID=930090 RepID=W6Z2G8_COCMI|nr:uncharacterized protein COCMIDRAFT_38177 [Bipolaris oryzae ATCC 44560]EUC43908.1 hypothetical protein COCMIDRAFT_38177 [Bipolaris oryzae ATCC 44560]